MERLPKEIYDLCIKVPYDGIKVYKSAGGQKDVMVSKRGYEGRYGSNSGVLMFVDERGDTYITPFIAEASAMLEEAGYQEADLGFASGTEIIDPRYDKVWKQMVDTQNHLFEMKRKKQVTDAINGIADEKGISDLPDFVKDVAIKLPEDGVKVKGSDGERKVAKFYKAYAGNYELGLVKETIGKYSSFEGDMFCFQDRNGDYYLIPREFIKVLDENGYSYSGGSTLLFGEKLTDERILPEYETLNQEMELVRNGEVDLGFVVALAKKKAEEKGITTGSLNESISRSI